MPNTVIGVLVFVAALGPGFLYIQIAERARPRQVRSTVGESVELVVIGATATTLAGLAVFGIGDALGYLSAQDLASKGLRVISEDTWTWLLGFGLVVVLSYGGAWCAAHLRYGGASDHDPASAGWNRAFRESVPEAHHAVVTVHLRDGHRISGYVLAWTSHLADSRELVLGHSLAMQGPNQGSPSKMEQDFVLLRESDVLFVAGHYVPVQNVPKGS